MLAYSSFAYWSLESCWFPVFCCLETIWCRYWWMLVVITSSSVLTINLNTVICTLFLKATLFWATSGWNREKIKQMLSNTMRLNFCYLKIIYILPPRLYPKIIGHILKNKQKNKCVCFHEIMRLIIIKMEMKMERRSIDTI